MKFGFFIYSSATKGSIFLKITALFMGLVCFTGGLLYVIITHQVKSYLEQEVQASLNLKSDLILSSIDRFVFERLSDLQQITQDPVLRNPNSTMIARERRLFQIKSEHPLYESFSFFDTRRVRIVDTKGIAIGKQHSYTKYWINLSTQELVMDISYSESLGEPVIHFAAHVRDEAGIAVGYVVTRVLISRLYEVFQNVVNKSDESTAIMLLAQDGQVLYANQNQAAVLHLRNEIPTFEGAHHIYTTDKDIISLSRQRGYLHYRGDGWFLMMRLSKHVAYAPVARAQAAVFENSLLVLLLAIGLALFFSRYFTQPIIQLSRLAREYGNGNLDATIRLKTHDERQLLADNMMKMAQQLRSKMEEQAELNRQLRYELQKSEEQKALIEDQNHQIHDSLHYAQRIQQAMLPTLQALQSTQIEAFVFFRPLQIVSGDFYWFERVILPDGEEYFLAAAIDCTGHGIPGAMMSILADNILYRLVNIEKNTDPKTILLRLDQEVRKMLRHDEHTKTRYRVQDGMDIGLCSIALATGRMLFCGAKRSLLHLREGVMVDYKGNKWTIGENSELLMRNKEDLVRSLKQHEVYLQEADQIYLFTDGITDQFGGQQNKKFGMKQLRSLLIREADTPLAQQKDALNAQISNWQGSQRQLDDMLLIGLRYHAYPQDPKAGGVFTSHFSLN